MPWESAVFVARPDWVKVLRKTSVIYTEFQRAFDDELVEMDDDTWLPFAELMPFARVTLDVQFGELAMLSALLRGVTERPNESEPPHVWWQQMLPPPTLPVTAMRLLREQLDYDWVAEWNDLLCARLLELDDEKCADLAARWSVDPGTVWGGSLDVDRVVPCAKLLEQLIRFCAARPSPDVDADAAGPLYLVVRNVT